MGGWLLMCTLPFVVLCKVLSIDPHIVVMLMVQTADGAHFMLVFSSDAKPVLKKCLKKVFIGYLRLEVDNFYYTKIALTYVDVDRNYSCWEVVSCAKLQECVRKLSVGDDEIFN